MEICQDLRLVDDAMHHERIAKEFENQEDEVAKSREEIELWKEKQRQVKKEEESITASENMKSKDEYKKAAEEHASVVNSNNWMSGRQEIHQIERRDIWTQQAAIFIEQGHYQAARGLLNEANTSALAFNDQRTLAKVFYYLALLSYRESNWQQSISFLEKLKDFKVDQTLWLKTVLLLVDAVCEKKDKHDPLGTRVDIHAKQKAIRVLKQSLATFKLLFQDSPNKACMAEYIAAKLQAKLGSVCAIDVIDETNEMSYLVDASEHLRSSEISLISCGCKQEAIDVKCERATILRRLAANSKTKADRRSFYLEALTLLRSAIRLCDVLTAEITSLCSPEEFCQVSLPVERISVECKLCFGELAIDIINDHAADERVRRNTEARKGSVEKLIDAFVQDEPVMTEQEKKWFSVTRSIVDETLVHVTAAFNQCLSIPYLKAKCYLVLGQCLRVLASYLNPNDETQWSIEQIPLVQTAKEQLEVTSVDEENLENDPEDEKLDHTSTKFENASKRVYVAEQLKVVYKDFKQTITQAVECLTQCVQLALKNEYNDIVSEASYLLMDIIGRHDIATSSSYLALYQSSSMAQTLYSLVERIQTDSSLSRLAAVIKQRDILAKKFLHQETVSSVLASTTQTLGEFEAWRRLAISKNHLEIVKELPCLGTMYLVLQHSKDRSFLYAATLDKPRSGVTSAKPGKQAAANAVTSPKALICRSKVKPGDLNKLLETFEIFRSEQAAELIRQNYLRRHVEETQSMLVNTSDESLDRNKDVLDNDLTVKDNEEKLQNKYVSFVNALETYLSPVLEQLVPVLNEKVIPETVVIFADEYLLRLPLESLTFLKNSQVQCVARDFSLQMHCHRFHSTENSGSEGTNEVKKPAGKKTGKSDAPTTAKSQDKKGEKKASKEQGIPKEGMSVDISALRYIVDPYNECTSNADESPEKVLDNVISKYRPFSAKWTGLIGTNHVPSVGEWQKLMKESSVFVFYGTQKYLNYIPPSLLVPFSLPECNIMVILDHTETNESFLRQSTLDASKTCSELTFEFPFESAAILSLTGVNCIVANQWNCKLRHNKEKFVKIFEATIDNNKSIGNAVRSFLHAKAENKTDQDLPAEDITEEVAPRQLDVIVSDNAVLYGVPYFILNHVKA